MIELLVVAAVLGLLMAALPSLMTGTVTNARVAMVKVKMQGDARNAVAAIQKSVRNAEADRVVVDQLNAGQPPYSRVEFVTVNGSTDTFWQDGDTLWGRHDGRDRVLCKDVDSVTFLYPELSDGGVLHIALALGKNVMGRKKVVQCVSEPVRVMN